MPPHAETDPVEPTEKLLRRAVHAQVRPGVPLVIERGAFTPAPGDNDGLSCNRSAFATPQEVADAAPPKHVGCVYVLEVSVATVLSAGATVRPDPLLEGPRGHALIPELAHAAYQANKKRMKELQLRLAQEADHRTSASMEARRSCSVDAPKLYVACTSVAGTKGNRLQPGSPVHLSAHRR